MATRQTELKAASNKGMKRLPVLFLLCFSIAIASLTFGCGTKLVPQEQPPTRHYTSVDESDPSYWNLAWKDNKAQFFQTLRYTAAQFARTHTYIQGETDCNDLAIELWNVLHTKGITSLIMVGNLEIEEATFGECNHAWLIVHVFGPAVIAIEPTTGELISNNSQYVEGFAYTTPSALRADFKERW